MCEVEIQSYPNLRTCTLGFVTHRGAAHDTIAGTTQVLLQTIFRGTRNYTESDIAKMIDGTGGSLFSTTEKDFTIIGAQVQPKYAVNTLDLLCDSISNPLIKKTHYEIEKEKLLQTYYQVQSNSLRRMLLFDADKAVFGETHPLSRPQIGTPDSLSKLSIETIQNTQQDLLIKPWGFAVGNISQKLKTKLKQKFQEYLSTTESFSKKLKPFPKREVPSKNIVTSLAKEDGNAYLCINVITKSNPNIIGLARFSSALLGESYGSRMFTILRDEKSFGYITGSALKLIDDSLVLRFFMETKPSRTEEAIGTLTEIIIGLGKEEISITEYNKTRDFLIGNLDLSFDDSRRIAARIINRAVHGLSPNIEKGYKEIQSVTSEDVLSTWKKLRSPDKFSLAVVGNIDPLKIQERWRNTQIS